MAKIPMQRLIILIISVFFLLGLGIAPVGATGVYDLPSLSDNTWVIDQADILSRVNEGKINSNLKNLAETTGNEVRMVTIRRLDYGETIDSFADELFTTWFPTEAEQANQTLLVLDSVTNNATIRTGENVKTIMSDEIASSVAIDNIGVPLREGNKYNQAFVSAGDRLVAVLSGEPDPGAPEIQDKINTEGTFTAAEETQQGSATIWVVVLLVLATVIPMATYFFYVGFSN